jgi:anti-sigma factor ChrR (cupin superfamily)
MTTEHLTHPITLNADLSQRCIIHSPSLAWVDSPASGVSRRMLERNGGEVARATSIVRYAPGSSFASHSHGGGEEILVLEGTLHDEHGVYGPGTYIKNPVGSSHAPSSPEGCTLFVKLRHLDARDNERVVIDTQRSEWRQGMVEGLKVLPLWCAGPHKRFSTLTGIGVAKKSLWLTACSLTSTATTPQAAGCAART